MEMIVEEEDDPVVGHNSKVNDFLTTVSKGIITGKFLVFCLASIFYILSIMGLSEYGSQYDTEIVLTEDNELIKLADYYHQNKYDLQKVNAYFIWGLNQ